MIATPVRAASPWIPLAAVATASAGAAAVLAQAGTKGIVVGVAVAAIGIALVAVRDRPLVLLAMLVLSLQFLLHKSFGPIHDHVHSGANALFVNNVSVLLVPLYAMWAAEGRLKADVAAALRRPVLWLPLAAAALTLPSLLVAEDLYLASAELARVATMYLLYLYVALRVRTRRDVAVIVGAFFVVAATQAVVATLQWRTGSSLGLSLLGEESELGVRMLDDGEIPRPSGTVVHPIFLASLVAPIGLVALAMSMDLGSATLRRACFAMAATAFLPLALAQARASLAAAAIATTLLCAAYVLAGRLRPLTVGVAFACAAALGLVFADAISERVFQNFGTDHFRTEVESRLELNAVALQMIADHPLVGVGLNNFETVLPEYDRFGLIFSGNPVHNLYLLLAAETGVIGLSGFVATFAAVSFAAWRAARSRDRFLRGVGAGILAGFAFFAVEELLSFALRQEMPLAAFWIFAGLAVAISRMEPTHAS